MHAGSARGSGSVPGEFADLSGLLAPRSVVIIGASDQPGNVGGAAVRFFRKFHSPCAVWPVNPGRDTVAGLPCYKNVAELPARADLAILAVPATAVAQVVRECVGAGIRAGIAWAGGFQEGGAGGVALQNELTALCRETGFALLGPNCIGIIDTHAPVTASFASMMLELDRFLPGNISMVSQSGGLATMGQAMAQLQGYGFRYMISTGNEAMLGVADFIHALAADPRTKVIATYLEGVRDGAKFRQALLDARDAGKPVIVLKAGATTASAAAAAAHTGALAGEDRVWEVVLRDCAALQVAGGTVGCGDAVERCRPGQAATQSRRGGRDLRRRQRRVVGGPVRPCGPVRACLGARNTGGAGRFRSAAGLYPQSGGLDAASLPEPAMA